MTERNDKKIFDLNCSSKFLYIREGASEDFNVICIHV